MKHFPELAAAGGGVFEPHTIHMPYLFSAQCMLTDSVVTRVLHVIIMMHDPQSACQVKVAHWTPSTHCAYFANIVVFFSFLRVLIFLMFVCVCVFFSFFMS